jgi:hypothetical protein
MPLYSPEIRAEKRESALAQYSAGTIGRITVEALLKIHGLREPEIDELLEACEPARKANTGGMR